MIVTATQVTLYTDISATAGTIVTSGLIPIVQDRINMITNNYFLTDLDIQGDLTFDSTANSIQCDTDWDDQGFIAGDEIYIYNSYRNDGYHTVESISGNTIIITSATSVIAEKTGRPIMVSVVRWPTAIAYLAAQMVKYDYDDRANQEAGVKSKTLGPYSVSFGVETTGTGKVTPFGYPATLVDGLSPYTIVRLN
jgi:hypothetical protein